MSRSPAFRFPADVAGWLSEAEGRALYDLARGKRVLEVGSFKGRSTICLAQSAKVVHSVDPFDGRATDAPGDTFPEYRANLERYGLLDRTGWTVGTFAGGLHPEHPDTTAPFDLIFIDGDHSYEAVRSDVARALGLLAPGGLLAFHDYRTIPGEYNGGWDPGVTRAVAELVRGGCELAGRHGTIAVVRPAAGATAPPERPRVFLGMPSYLDVSIAAASAFFRPTLGAVEVVATRAFSGSATPHVFNNLWVEAIAARDAGRATHFAMLHADVAPNPGFLDILHREMVAHEADVISAVVPFKDSTGRTSTAIGGPDPWRALRYVTLAHRGILPATFTAADVCRGDELLMVNTGCMLLDLRRPWWDVPTDGGPGGSGFAWEFRTRIATVERANPDGTTTTARVPQFAPEDWIMSRHVAQHGGKVAATWAVELEHKGAANFSNRAG